MSEIDFDRCFIFTKLVVLAKLQTVLLGAEDK